jgi:hypothetical protein
MSNNTMGKSSCQVCTSMIVSLHTGSMFPLHFHAIKCHYFPSTVEKRFLLVVVFASLQPISRTASSLIG